MTTAETLGGMNLFDAARAAGITFSAEVLPEDQYVEANGMRLHYLDWGNRHQPKMLLLHGGAQSAHSWDLFRPGDARLFPHRGAGSARTRR